MDGQLHGVVVIALGLVVFLTPLLTFIAFFTVQLRAEMAAPSLLGQHPRSRRHRRLMAHMLSVAAFKIRHPMTFLILVKADDSTNHKLAGPDYRTLAS